jgi:pimeloyl-ACP methyl ester carboxylesterase
MYKLNKAAASLVLAACLGSLAACQTTENPNNRPRQVDYDLGGYFDSLPRDFPEMRKYHASDGSMLTFSGYRHGRKNPVALIYLHGLEGHAGWGRELAVKLADRSYDVFALDRRGSGLSKGNTKTITGKPLGFEDLVSDVHSFLKPLKGYYDSVYLIGNDWGARLALAYGIAYQGQSDGLVLISPRVTNDAPAAFDASQQTADTGRQQEMTTDPFIQLFLAGEDDIIDRDKVIKLLEKGSQPSLDIQSVTGAEHALPVEAPDRIARDIHHWVHYQELSRKAGKTR